MDFADESMLCGRLALKILPIPMKKGTHLGKTVSFTRIIHDEPLDGTREVRHSLSLDLVLHPSLQVLMLQRVVAREGSLFELAVLALVLPSVWLDIGTEGWPFRVSGEEDGDGLWLSCEDPGLGGAELRLPGGISSPDICVETCLLASARVVWPIADGSRDGDVCQCHSPGPLVMIGQSSWRLFRAQTK